MEKVLEQIAQIGIVPVIKVEDISLAVPLTKALIDGGINCAEVTFRAEGADKAIEAMSNAYPDMIIGAGTVLTPKQADDAVKAGAKFIVSPGFNPKTLEHCQKIGVPMTPGCITPSEIELAIEMGLDVIKFFPAEQAGGLAMLKALSGPFPQLRFMPTGGISLSNLGEYLSFSKVIACGGSFMVKEEFIKNRQWDKITELSRQAVECCKNARRS